MKIAIRLSCVAAAGFALAAGSAGADEGVIRDPPPADGASGPAADGNDVYFDASYFDGDPTGGACFYETMGGDGIAIASELGFTVSEVYEGSCVADPGEANGLFDVVVLCSILNGADPYAGCEPDDFLRAPEGSQYNGVVLGSSFGRAQYLRQSCVTTIRGRQAHEFATGAGVTVAVLDTGIDRTHALFSAEPGRVLAGRDIVDLDDVPDEEQGRGYGHGTTVAGLVLLAAPDARILPVRILDADGIGSAGRIAAGIRYAADAGAHVVNMSLGGDGRSSAVRDALLDAQQRGVVVVAASGNRRQSDPPQYPALEEGVIAATGSVGQHGDVWAPSVGLAGPYPSERWFRGTGTSFSCALVSGGAALAKQQRPGITSYEIVARLQRRADMQLPSFQIVDALSLDLPDPVRLNLVRLVR
jgi:subtilisin family serine protease